MFDFAKLKVINLSKFLTYFEETPMSLQDDLNTAKSAVDAVHAELDAANFKLNVAQAAVDAAVPHLSVLAELEGFGAHIEASSLAEFTALIAKARALF